MKTKAQTLWLLVLLPGLALSCERVEKQYIYMYPDAATDGGGGSDAGDGFVWGAPDSLSDQVDEATSQDVAPDVPADTMPDFWADKPHMDFAVPDGTVLPDVVHMDQYLHQDTEPEDTYSFPEITDDCDPLGLPTKWVGTFDGEVVSNIPDFAGYTFNGPVTGEISFEIKCVNQKYLVVGELDGGATNCALPTGCPFTTTLAGFYNTQTQHMEGQVKDGVIDYSAVIVKAEGVFDGDLVSGPALEGSWSGEKTEIINNLIPGLDLAWVEATGAGTWTAEPVEE